VRKILLNRMVIDVDYDLSNLEINNYLNLFKGLDNFSILRVCQGYVMQGKNRYFRHSHLSEAKFRALIRYFAHDLRAWKIAELSGVSRPTINQLFMKLRIRIAQVCNASSPLFGEVEVDESYFGARRVRGKRGAEQAVNRSSSESWNATGKCEHEFARSNCHINGIESFWSYAKRRLAKFNAVPRQTFLLHLKECEFRFHHREENLSDRILILLKENPL